MGCNYPAWTDANADAASIRDQVVKDEVARAVDEYTAALDEFRAANDALDAAKTRVETADRNLRTAQTFAAMIQARKL